MWFDPDREVPSLRSLPTGSDESEDRLIEGHAQAELEQRTEADGTLREVGGVPCEGDAAKMSEDSSNDMPF